MALKFYSFANMLEIGGDGGGTGDKLTKAIEHQAFPDPTRANEQSPPRHNIKTFGDAANSAGDTEAEYPCVFHEHGPTVPTDLTEIRTVGGQAANDSNSAVVTDLSGGEVEAQDPDRWCWPNSGAEIDLMQRRLDLFARQGIADLHRDKLVDKLLVQDREGNDRCLCLPYKVEKARCLLGDPTDNPVDWKVLAATYHDHHFSCQTCIAAGRGNQNGQRCGIGMALWTAYQTLDSNVKNDELKDAVITKTPMFTPDTSVPTVVTLPINLGAK